MAREDLAQYQGLQNGEVANDACVGSAEEKAMERKSEFTCMLENINRLT